MQIISHKIVSYDIIVLDNLIVTPTSIKLFCNFTSLYYNCGVGANVILEAFFISIQRRIIKWEY